MSKMKISAAPALDWSLSPRGIEKVGAESLKKTRRRIDELVSLPDGERDFKNTAAALDRILSDLDTETRTAAVLKYFSPEKAVRDASHACETRLANFHIDVFAREDLYRAVRAGAERAQNLTGPEQKLLEKTLREFRQNGLELPPLERARFTLLTKQLVDMCLSFGRNLNEARGFLAVTKEQLDGLPENYIAGLEQLPDGRCKVTLDYPDAFPFLENAHDAEARRELQFLMHNRAAPENAALLEEILSLRRRLAKMLGCNSHAESVLEDRMAKNPPTVRAFLKRLRERLTPAAKKDLARLLAEKRKDDPKASRLEPWDLAYYRGKVRKTEYSVDDEAVRAYFPVEKVTQGMFECYSSLFELDFEEIKDAKAWHPDVRRFAVREAGAKETIGEFYLDLFPREGKFSHGAAFALLRERREPDGSYRRPSAAMVVNFSKPAKDRPALLKFDEVRTFFHEFGHIMHNILARADHPRFAGTLVSRDFCEVPSTMFEKWIWLPEVLKRISGHFETGEALPDDLLRRMLRAKNFIAAFQHLRGVALAWIDQEYHGPDEADSTEVYRRWIEEIALLPSIEGTFPQATIGHFAGGYDASLYAYLWSEIYALDMFSRFEVDGVFDPMLGRLYRKTVLEPGGSGDELEYVRAFLGREPTEEAFFRSIGLGREKAAASR